MRLFTIEYKNNKTDYDGVLSVATHTKLGRPFRQFNNGLEPFTTIYTTVYIIIYKSRFIGGVWVQ